MVNHPIGNHGMWIFWCGQIWPLDPSFKVKWGQPNLKVLITRLLLVLEVWDGKPTYRKSLAVNVFVWLDLILDPFFKVERGYCICSISLKYVLTYFLHLNNYLVTFLHNTICRAQLFCPFLLSASEFLSNMLFNYHLLYFCTALSLIIMLSSHYHLHKSKTLIQLTQCPFTGTLLLFVFLLRVFKDVIPFWYYFISEDI